MKITFDNDNSTVHNICQAVYDNGSNAERTSFVQPIDEADKFRQIAKFFEYVNRGVTIGRAETADILGVSINDPILDTVKIEYMIDEDAGALVAKILTNWIDVDDDTQRTHCKDIGKFCKPEGDDMRYDASKAEIGETNHRDGRIFAMNAMHRTTGACFAGRVTVIVRIHHLTKEEEADRFVKQAAATSIVSQYDRFHKGLTSKYKECILLNMLITLFNLNPIDGNNGRSITSISAMLGFVNRGKLDNPKADSTGLQWMLNIMERSLWLSGDTPVLTSRCINAFRYTYDQLVVREHKDPELLASRLIDVMSKRGYVVLQKFIENYEISSDIRKPWNNVIHHIADGIIPRDYIMIMTENTNDKEDQARRAAAVMEAHNAHLITNAVTVEIMGMPEATNPNKNAADVPVNESAAKTTEKSGKKTKKHNKSKK